MKYPRYLHFNSHTHLRLSFDTLLDIDEARVNIFSYHHNNFASASFGVCLTIDFHRILA